MLHCYLTLLFDKRSDATLIFVPVHNMVFSSGHFKNFLVITGFSNLDLMNLGVVFPVFLMLGIYWAFLICRFIVFIKFWEISPNICSALVHLIFKDSIYSHTRLLEVPLFTVFFTFSFNFLFCCHFLKLTNLLFCYVYSLSSIKCIFYLKHCVFHFPRFLICVFLCLLCLYLTF